MKKLYICIFILTWYMPALAQEPAADTVKSYLDEVVVSANRWEQNVREVAGLLTKISARDVQFQNPQTAADLLGLSQQVFIQKSQLGGGSPMIRGFATNRVMLVVDGVRMNNAIFRGGNLQNVISLDPNVIRESEVLFGPGSVMYGSDAIGGVMDFHTLQPKLSETGKMTVNGNVLTRYASANSENTAHANVTLGFKKIGFTTSFTRGVFDDLRMGSRGPDEYTRPDYQVRDGANDIAVPNPDPNVQVSSGYSQTNVMQKVYFKPNASWELSYGFHFSETSDVPRYDRLILKNAAGVFTNAEWYYGPQKWTMHALTATHTNATLLFDRLRLTTAYQDYTESRHNRNFTGGNRNRITERFENVEALSFNLDIDKQLSTNTSLFYGAEWVQNDVASTSQRRDIVTEAITPVSTRYPNGSVWRSAAAYVSLRHKFNDRWLLNASGRYSDVYTYAPFDLTFFPFPFSEATLNNGAFNGSLGAVYTPDANTKIYGNLSTGFRAPNVDDIGKVFDSQPGTVLVPNPDLQPEYAYNAEVGANVRLANRVTVDVAAFYTRLDNAIVRGNFLFNGQDSIVYDGTRSRVIALQNTSEVTVRGVQASIRAELMPGLTLFSTLNLQQGEERDPETGQIFSPTHIAPTFGTTQLTYRRAKWMVMAYANYNGEISFENLAVTERADAHLYARDSNGQPYAPAWTTLNLKGSYSPIKYFTIDAGIENIADTRYRPYSSGISAPGRNFIVALRARF